MNCPLHAKREGRSPGRSPATARQLECKLYSVPLSHVAPGKASKAPGDRGAGLEGHTGTRHAVREWSLTGRHHGPRALANRSAARGGSGGIGIPGRTLREMPTADPADGTFYILRSPPQRREVTEPGGLAPRPRCRAPAICGPLQGKAGPGVGSQMPGGTFPAMGSHPAPFLQEPLGDIAHG